jgi:hypothetical protein
MSRLDEFRVLQPKKGPRCTYELMQLSEDDRAALTEALALASITSKAIELWLEKRGQRWRYFAIARHRRGECRCSGV